MAQKTMYPAKSGSPYTTTTAAIGVSDTEISVAELSGLPAAPNVCVIYVSAAKWERCLYSAKSNESGAGTITVSRSATGHASTDGSNGPLEFDAGAKVMRNFTAYDHDLFKDNIEDLEARKITSTGVTFENLNTNGDVGTGSEQVSQGNHTHPYQPLDATLTAFAGITTAANKLPYATGEDTFGVCDFTPLGQSLIGTTTASAVRDLIASASSTTATQNIYVDAAATGTGTGVDWPNAFTTIQAAVDSLPAVINHAVTIIIRKGSTPYNEKIKIQRVIAAGSITLLGEYFWYGTVAASKTGKITVGVSDYGYADRAQIAVGDIVWATKWSGAVGASTPSESIIDTVASVSGAEVSLTTNTGKTFDTTWTYQIVKTEISNIQCKSTDFVTITGLSFKGGGTYLLNIYNCAGVVLSCCYFSPTAEIPIGQLIRIESSSYVYPVIRCCVDSTYSNTRGVYIVGPYINLQASVINLTGASTIGVLGLSGAVAACSFSHIKAAVVGIQATSLSIVVTGSNLNESTNPKSPATNPGPDGGYIA